MPSYKLTIDGQTYRISGEDEQQIQAKVAEIVGSGAQPEQEAPGGFVMGMRDPIDAAAQMLEKALPASLVTRLNMLNNYLADKGLPLVRMDERGLTGQLADLEAGYQARRSQEGDTGVDWDRLAGAVPTGAALSAMFVPATAATVPGRLAIAGTGGAAMGALSQPVPDSDAFWQEKLKQAALGGGLGVAGSGVMQGIGHLGRQARRPEVAALREAGVEPTIGQTIGGRVSRGEERLASIPVLGDAISSARDRARIQFNTAAINEALAPLGARVQGAGHGAIDDAQRILSRAYEDAADMIPGVRFDDVARQRVDSLISLLRGAPAQAEDDFMRFYREVFQRRLGDAVGFEPRTFKSLDSDIGARIRNSQGELRSAFQELRETLRDAAARQHPEYDAAKRAADAAYARMVAVEDASVRAAVQEGVFTPGQLVQAAKKGDTSVRKRATARGDALMQDFADIGQDVLGNVVPNSGTADRSLLAALAAAPFDPTIAASLTAGPVIYTPTMQRAINAGMRRLPDLQGTQGAALLGLLGGQR